MLCGRASVGARAEGGERGVAQGKACHARRQGPHTGHLGAAATTILTTTLDTTITTTEGGPAAPTR